MKRTLTKPRTAAAAHVPVAVLAALALTGGCGYQDWEAPLTGGYRVGTAGSSQVRLWSGDALSDIVRADEDIVAYGCSARFIELRLGTLGDGVPRAGPRFVLIDVEKGAHEQFGTEQELLLALPPDTAAMPWTQSRNPNTPGFVRFFMMIGVVVVIGLAVMTIVVMTTRKRKRPQPQ